MMLDYKNMSLEELKKLYNEIREAYSERVQTEQIRTWNEIVVAVHKYLEFSDIQIISPDQENFT